MKETVEKSSIEKLREAWGNAPSGAKARMYEAFGYTKQNVSDVLKNGRKDESVILSLLNALKQASKDIASDVNAKNKLVQSV